MKNKETLEEAFIRFMESNHTGIQITKGFVLGAMKFAINWQQEQDKKLYSKEDVNHLEWIYNRMIGLHNENKDYDYMVKFKEILDQFKTK